jgi:hypothetical protein
MAATIKGAEYFYTTVTDRPGEAYNLLSQLADSDATVLAFSAVPIGPDQTQLMVFPQNVDAFVRASERAGVKLAGPHHAILVRGDDNLGSLIEIHRKLFDANINIYASSGVTADCGRFGYLVHVREEDFERASLVLGA